MAVERLLLDTCALIWLATGGEIAPAALAALRAAADAGEKVAVSPISAWELGLLFAKGRMTAVKSPIALFQEIAHAETVIVEPLTADILIDSSFLPKLDHRDPADCIIIATARTMDRTILTRDRAILDYARRGYVRAIAC